MAKVRLVVERSWFAIAVGVGLLAGGGAMLVVAFSRMSFEFQLPAVLMFVGGLLVWRGVDGSWAGEQIRVDVPGGTVDFGTSKIPSRPLATLGTLSLFEHQEVRRRSHGSYVSTEFQLRAETIEQPLFASLLSRAKVQKRLDKLKSCVLQSALRPVLGRPDVDGAAFRSADIGDEIRRIAAGDADGLRAALTALTLDHDATIRSRAREALALAAKT